MKLSNQLIKDIHAECPEFRERIEKEAGKLFSVTIEFNKWWILNEWLIFVTGVDKGSYTGYGFDTDDGIWFDECRIISDNAIKVKRLATPEEVKSALDAERVKRGLVEGVNIDTSSIYPHGGVRGKISSETRFLNDHLEAKAIEDIGWITLFLNGAWATPITAKKMTVAEISKELGYDVEIVK